MSDDLIRIRVHGCLAWLLLVFVPPAVLVLVGRCEAHVRAETIANICADRCKQEWK